ncbi:hypothetical protein CBR_g934 [Chara braunii]|uniref:Uncharacterized protein n=1 Tax=Chara braunii TaxID=69332 RepID=A0A388KCQ5_CHABU|nr:hypothetical protein CBR_g934 [Chara braunii]|eukprot:GBG67811.1 hypothetical protein CBR_g934 [Chara braunii]
MRQKVFWIRCLEVPVGIWGILKGVVQDAFGAVLFDHQPFKKLLSPDLRDVRFDLVPSAKLRYKKKLIVDLHDKGFVEVDVVCAGTPWCSKCRRYFHRDSDVGCPAKQKAHEKNPTEKAPSQKENSPVKEKDPQKEKLSTKGILLEEKEIISSKKGPAPDKEDKPRWELVARNPKNGRKRKINKKSWSRKDSRGGTKSIPSTKEVSSKDDAEPSGKLPEVRGDPDVPSKADDRDQVLVSEGDEEGMGVKENNSYLEEDAAKVAGVDGPPCPVKSDSGGINGEGEGEEGVRDGLTHKEGVENVVSPTPASILGGSQSKDRAEQPIKEQKDLSKADDSDVLMESDDEGDEMEKEEDDSSLVNEEVKEEGREETLNPFKSEPEPGSSQEEGKGEEREEVIGLLRRKRGENSGPPSSAFVFGGEKSKLGNDICPSPQKLVEEDSEHYIETIPIEVVSSGSDSEGDSLRSQTHSDGTPDEVPTEEGKFLDFSVPGLQHKRLITYSPSKKAKMNDKSSVVTAEEKCLDKTEDAHSREKAKKRNKPGRSAKSLSSLRLL